jgi:hypothetical protein
MLAGLVFVMISMSAEFDEVDGAPRGIWVL